MNNLLINERPIAFSGRLAVKIGVNQAIIIQTIADLMSGRDKTHEFDGKIWISHSYNDLRDILRFFSLKTIQRHIKDIESKQLIISKKLKSHPMDSTRIRTINFEKLKQLGD